MATLTIKNLPADLYTRLKARAALEGRSLNRQAIVALEQSMVMHSAADTEAFLAKVMALRERIGPIDVSADWVNEAKREGRD
jgi:plasmid stability protein